MLKCAQCKKPLLDSQPQYGVLVPSDDPNETIIDSIHEKCEDAWFREHPE